MDKASKKEEPSKRVPVSFYSCTGGCGFRIRAAYAELAMCLPCLGLYEALDEAGVSSVAALDVRARCCSRIVALIQASGAPDAEALLDFLRALVQ